MAFKDIIKGLSDASAVVDSVNPVSSAIRSIKALFSGNFGKATAGNLTNVIDRLKNLVGDVKDIIPDQAPNSGLSEAMNPQGVSINDDGSTNIDYSNINADQLLTLGASWLMGANPEIQRMFSAKEAQKERDWQTQMSNTAYQRSMADMQAAGLNPILAYAQGGATSGGGASAAAPSSAQSAGSMLQGIGNIISTVLEKDIKSDAQASKAALDMLKYKDSHSATQASNEYYKTLNKINNMKLEEASKIRNRVGF